MTGCNVIYVHDVESGVDVRRHPARSGVEDHLARGCWLYIAWPDRCRRIDDDHRSASARRSVHDLFREEFRSFVVADHVCQRDRCGFRAGRAIGRYADSGNTARVDDTLDTCEARSLQDIARPLHIGPVELLRLARPEAIVCRNMEQRLAIGERGGERCRVRKLPRNDLYLQMQ